MTNEGDACVSGGSIDDGGSPTDESNGGVPETDRFPLGAIVNVLSHPVRRRALDYLQGRESPVGLAELADELGASDVIAEPLEGTIDRQQRLRRQLYHVHAPKMDDAGLATFDDQAHTVAITEDGADALDLF